MEESFNLPTSLQRQESNTESTTRLISLTEETKLCEQHMNEDCAHIDVKNVNSEIIENGSLEYGYYF